MPLTAEKAALFFNLEVFAFEAAEADGAIKPTTDAADGAIVVKKAENDETACSTASGAEAAFVVGAAKKLAAAAIESAAKGGANEKAEPLFEFTTNGSGAAAAAEIKAGGRCAGKEIV